MDDFTTDGMHYTATIRHAYMYIHPGAFRGTTPGLCEPAGNPHYELSQSMRRAVTPYAPCTDLPLLPGDTR